MDREDLVETDDAQDPKHVRRYGRQGDVRLLGPGDTLLLYTDGLTEARTGHDRTGLYGDEALLAFAAAHAGESPHAVIQALTGLLDSFGDGLDDDTALLAIGVPAAARQTRNER